MGISPEIRLKGTLTCISHEAAARVRASLPAHIALTRAETGCLSFEVLQTADPLVWSVTERFTDKAAFDAHQTRASASEWARETAGIARDYEITGLQ